MVEINNKLIITAQALHTTDIFGDFKIYSVLNLINKKEHMVLLKGEPDIELFTICRVSSSCITGTALYSNTCDCKLQNEKSLELINQNGTGIFIYLDQEGRNNGLSIKIKGLQNKNSGLDTFTAIEELNIKTDNRTYEDAIDIVRYFNPNSIILLTSNPRKIEEFHNSDIKIEKVQPINIEMNENIEIHLKAKIKRGYKI